MFCGVQQWIVRMAAVGYFNLTEQPYHMCTYTYDKFHRKSHEIHTLSVLLLCMNDIFCPQVNGIEIVIRTNRLRLYRNKKHYFRWTNSTKKTSSKRFSPNFLFFLVHIYVDCEMNTQLRQQGEKTKWLKPSCDISYTNGFFWQFQCTFFFRIKIKWDLLFYVWR